MITGVLIGERRRRCDDRGGSQSQSDRSEDALPLALKMKKGTKARDAGGFLDLKKAKEQIFPQSLQKELRHADRWILAQGNPFQTSYLQNCQTVDLCWFEA